MSKFSLSQTCIYGWGLLRFLTPVVKYLMPNLRLVIIITSDNLITDFEIIMATETTLTNPLQRK
jgi:hypothetical protein